MQQFSDLKEQYPDAILFFQMGDFFETFGDDAQTVARELDITLTSRGAGKDGARIPLAGVPIHAGDAYIARLVEKGYRVAVCEQLEDPKKTKGVVKRDVVRVVTPGTVMDAGMHTSPAARYLAALTPLRGKGDGFGMACLDCSTGEFFVMETGAEREDLAGAIARTRPAEIIVPPSVSETVRAMLEESGAVITVRDKSAFDPDAGRTALTERFGVASLAGFGCDDMEGAVGAAGAVLAYAQETQRSDLPHINGVTTRHPDTSLVLDAVTLRNLEIVEGIRGGPGGSLLETIDRTLTPMGARLLRARLTAPLVDPAAIDERLDAVEWFTHHTESRSEVRHHLGHAADVERIAGRIAHGNATPRDLSALLRTLDLLPDLFGALAGDLPDEIASARSGLGDHRSTIERIRAALVDDPPVTARAGGMIREGYSDDLDHLRALSTSAKDWIAEFQEKERERTGIKSLKIRYNRVFGYFIEVTRPNLHLVPEEYIRKQTTAGGERFTLPVLDEMESRISRATEEASVLEQELYRDLIRDLSGEVPDFKATAHALASLDVSSALAEVAVVQQYTRPIIDGERRLLIRDGRHPVVEVHGDGRFVPNDTDLDACSTQIMILTGANMAGKSTYMRAVALICIMAQTGSFVPARHATVGVVDRVFTRVGAFDDLAHGQSTFMVEMQELSNILRHVTDRSLVVLDEIGRGTSTLDGSSIARAVLEDLHGKKSCGPRTLFATHFHDLVDMEDRLRRVANFHFAVRETGEDVVFLRALIPGATDRSYGIHVARLGGVPERVCDRAYEILKELSARTLPSGERAPTYTQMLLVDPTDGDPASDPVRERLREIDPDSLSPREALDLLYELTAKLEKRGGSR
ncbi:MAG: DNA mismatch repair protein MutS [Methanomicrobiales archaeon]